MTVSHGAPPLDAPDIESAVAALRERGMRVSAARRVVLEALYAEDEPLSAEQISAGLGGRLPESDIASVYRNLETLEKLGLVRHFHLGHGPGLYARTGAATREYLVCEACGNHLAVEPGALDEVRETVRRGFGYEARFSHFPIAGLCPDCSDAGGSS